MNQKILMGTFIVIVCVLFVVGSGCTSKQEGALPPATQTPEATITPTAEVTTVTTPSNTTPVPTANTPLLQDDLLNREGTGDQDTAYNLFFLKSQAEIINKTNDLIEAMVPGSMTVQAVYSPSLVYVRAEDLGYTTENYYDRVLEMKVYTPENEMKRVAYLQFLYSAKSSAFHIADAAEAESYGNYRDALVMASAAKLDLQNIEADPDLPPTLPYNLLDVFLNEYIGRLRDKEIASEIKESTSSGSRFPSRP
ncbi:MAG: hypothetical protein LUQ37_05360 [Methanoregulaceae archaeon]|nr:hypothetical protein [Methanoregulaceae archaeon]